ncbi:MAG TPA: hypothetical protein VGH70_03810 [Bradyrhizobium sp.]|jgi:hypothetical protein
MSRKPVEKVARQPSTGLELPVLASSSAARFFLLKATLLAAFCIGLSMSSALWIGPRSFPLVPVIPASAEIESHAAIVLYGALFTLAAAALIARWPRWFIAAFLGVILVFCLEDQTRWQPWVFQYSLLMAVIALVPLDGQAGHQRALNLGRLIVAFTYLFSGLQKINSNFMFVDFPWLVQPITALFPSIEKLVPVFGALAPFVQAAFGIGLLTRRWRRISLIAAVAMHVFILTMFGPLGHNWNNVVWPWTAAMAVFDVILFSGTSEFTWPDVVATRRDPLHIAALALFVALPVLSFFNLWDSYLSAALYSGNLTEAQIYISDVGMASVPAGVRSRTVHTSPNTNVLNIQRWAIEDLNVMPYPETRAYKAIGRSVCHDVRTPGQLVLIVHEQRLFGSREETGFQCPEL